VTATQERYQRFFQLQPFVSVADCQSLQLSGSIDRLPGILAIEYRLIGDLPSIIWPVSSSNILRRHELWRQTCFELFFGAIGESGYWEVNLAPNGCWNLYHFNEYRQGMLEDTAIKDLPSRAVKDGDTFSLSCRVDMHKLIPDCKAIEVGVAGIVLNRTGETAYWAIDHLKNIPDFHIRQSFRIVLPGMTNHF
jgi:hypothetical protein